METGVIIIETNKTEMDASMRHQHPSEGRFGEKQE